MAQQSIEYGYRQGHDRSIIALPMAASEVLKKQGGGFVKTNTSGNGVIAAATDTGIVGALRFTEDFTCSSTAGATILPCDTSLESEYELPLGSASTWADTQIGNACDLIVESSIQKVNLNGNTDKTMLVIGKGTTNAAGTVLSALVRINPAALVQR
jgi:hypothetical protein